MVADLKEERKRIDSMIARLNDSQADALLAKAEIVGDARLVVCQAEEGEDATSLATTLISRPGVIAVIGSAVPSVKLIVGRSQDVALDSRPVLKEIMKLIGGGGGGKPDLAQGGGGDPSKMPQALAEATAIVRAAAAAQ